MKKTNIVKYLTKAFIFCLCCIFSMGVLCSTAFIVNAADEPSDGGVTAIITDLKGYTVTVPSGWSASSGYGEFNFVGTIHDNSFDSNDIYFDSSFDKLSIGYAWTGNNTIPSSSRIACGRANFEWSWSKNTSLTFHFHGGDTTNSSLIQWLYDNNATFVKDREAIVGWSADETIGFFGTPIVQTTPPVVDDYQTIYYYAFWDKPYAILRDVVSTDGNSYMPVVFYYDTYYEALYYGISEEQRDLVATDVYMNGYNEGYLQGKTEGQSSSIGTNLIGSGFTSITQALNQIIVYQSSSGTVVTLWVIISGAVGIALFIWILKLFAGG